MAHHERRWVTTARQTQRTGRRIDIGEDQGRHALPDRLLEQETIEPLDEVGAAVALLDQCAERGLDHRHQQSGRQTMTGNVAHGDDRRAIAESEDVKGVTSNLRGGSKVCVDGEGSTRHAGFRQQALLNLAGEFHLPLHACLVGNLTQHGCHRSGHAVERNCEIAELVPAAYRNAVVKVATSYCRGAARQPGRGASDRKNLPGRERDRQEVGHTEDNRYRDQCTA